MLNAMAHNTRMPYLAMERGAMWEGGLGLSSRTFDLPPHYKKTQTKTKQNEGGSVL
jgi:hypothetical protein